jgi:hypothetical protein
VNSTQLRLPKPLPGPPVIARNTRYSRCDPAKSRSNVWLLHVVLAPVDSRVAVEAIGPVRLPRWISGPGRVGGVAAGEPERDLLVHVPEVVPAVQGDEVR